MGAGDQYQGGDMNGASGLQTSHQHQGGDMSDANENAGQETLGERRQGAEMHGVSDTLLQSEHGEWRRVCAISVLPEQSGRSAWLDGRSLALFRLGERVYALDDLDPLAGVAVLSRGLVGDCGGEPVVASPLYKQRYALADGRCLDDPALKEFTTLIIEQADRLRNLVDRLLGPQRPTQHSLHNIHQVVQKVHKLVEMALPANIQLKRDYDPSIPDIEMDPDQMQQAVLNILQNAVQALEHTGGEILIRTRTQHQVTIGSQRHKLVLTLSIIDNGPGIPPELMDTLFYPMVTSREQGSGLGLSIAHNIARLHSGRIDCLSSAGHTEFIISLPILSAK